jgi:PrcB C-terminal
MKSKFHGSIGVLLVISACSGATPELGIPVRLSSGSSSLYASSQAMVKLDSSARGFNQTWQLMHGNQIPPPITPNINFETARVVTFFMGLRPTSGYGFSVVQASKLEAQTLTVVVRLQEPASNATVIPMLTSPFSSLSLNNASFTQVQVVNEATGEVIAVSEPAKLREGQVRGF